MNKTYQTFNLGGKDRGFRLRNKTVDLIGELTGADPLEFVPKAQTWVAIREYGKTILHAGILSELDYNSQEVDFTNEDMQRWMDDLSPQVIYAVSDMYQHFMNPTILTANGEVGKDTQDKATNVAGA